MNKILVLSIWFSYGMDSQHSALTVSAPGEPQGSCPGWSLWRYNRKQPNCVLLEYGQVAHSTSSPGLCMEIFQSKDLFANELQKKKKDYLGCLFTRVPLPQVLRWHSGKESTCQCRKLKSYGFNPWVRKIAWRRKWQPPPIFFPENSMDWQAPVHGVSESDIPERLSTHSHLKFICLSKLPMTTDQNTGTDELTKSDLCHLLKWIIVQRRWDSVG